MTKSKAAQKIIDDEQSAYENQGANATQERLPIPQQGGVISQIPIAEMGLTNYDGPRLMTSLPMETTEQKAAVFNAVSGPCDSLADCIGQIIPVVDYVAERGLFQFEDDPEPKIGVKLWLIDASGKRYFNGSRSVVAALQRVFAYFEPPPWSPPMKLVFTKSETKNHRPWYDVERVF